ncbi:MAG: hypothetical protein SNJ58_00145 [Aggregatilineales bacterium]
MQDQPKRRDESTESLHEPGRSLSQRVLTAWRDIRDARGVRANVLKIALVLVLAWLLAGAIQQLVIIALALGVLWLLFDVVRRNIFR